MLWTRGQGTKLLGEWCPDTASYTSFSPSPSVPRSTAHLSPHLLNSDYGTTIRFSSQEGCDQTGIADIGS